MHIVTRDFGELDVDSEEIITFKMPIYGFEDQTEYILISDPDYGSRIVWLQSVHTPELCFILMDPTLAAENYRPLFSAEVTKTLQDKGILAPEIWAIAVIAKEFRNSSINLKSPVLIDPSSRCAAQIILEEEYPIRASLVSAGKEC